MPKRKVDSKFELAQRMYQTGAFKKKKPKLEDDVAAPKVVAAAKPKRAAAAVKPRSTPRKASSNRKPTRESARGKKQEDEEEETTEVDDKSLAVVKQENTPQQVIQLTESTDIEMTTMDHDDAMTMNQEALEPQPQVVFPPPQDEASIVQEIQHYQEPEPPKSIASVPMTPPRAKSEKKFGFGSRSSPIPQAAPPNQPFSRYAGLDTIQESLVHEREEELPLAPAIVPDVDDDDEEVVTTQYPKSFKFEFYLMVISILMAIVSFGAAVYFVILDGTPQVTFETTTSTSSCPPGGRCVDGVLTECLPYLKIVDGACVLEDDAAIKIRMIDRLLHKYSFDHIRLNTKDDDNNPYFAREEEGRPLYYLSSVAKALEIQADAELLYAANILEDKFFLSGGFLVGVHPHKAIQGSAYAHGQVVIRKIASIIAFLVWSVLVTIFAIYSTWFQQAKILTSLATIFGIFVVLIVRKILIKRRALSEKEQLVLQFRKLVYAELYKSRGSVDAEVLFARVLVNEFPSNRPKRDQVKKDVWRHILNDAESDIRIQTENVQGKRFWEWTDSTPPAM